MGLKKQKQTGRRSDVALRNFESRGCGSRPFPRRTVAWRGGVCHSFLHLCQAARLEAAFRFFCRLLATRVKVGEDF